MYIRRVYSPHGVTCNKKYDYNRHGYCILDLWHDAAGEHAGAAQQNIVAAIGNLNMENTGLTFHKFKQLICRDFFKFKHTQHFDIQTAEQTRTKLN